MSSFESFTLLVSSGNGPGECQQAVAHILEKIEEEARGLGVDMDISARKGRYGPTSAIVSLNGCGSRAFAQGWVGAVLWRCQSKIRPKHKRKNWFAQVFALPDPVAAVTINPQEVQMTAIRAGGPGGQHQNKTSSAIRARWVDGSGRGYNVVVREDRSQHRNRKIAVERLQSLVSSDLAEQKEVRSGGTHRLHHGLSRGSPDRIFDGPDFTLIERKCV